MSSTTISTATSHDGELVPGTSYQVRIQSYVYNNSGVRLTSPWSTTINATPYGPKPAKPTGLYPFTDDSQISLLWHSPVDNTITSCQYALSTDGGESFDDWQDMTALAVKYKSYLLTGLDRRQLVLPVATTIFAGRDGVIIRYGGAVDYRPTNQAIEAETYGRQDTGNGSGQGWDERAFSAQVAEWPIAVAGETGASVAHSARSLRRGVGG